MSRQSPYRTKLIAKIDDIVKSSGGPAGLSVAIASSNATPFFFHAGFADISKEEPIEDEHIFGIGSITKVFVAVVVLQLIEEGRLSLSDTVSSHLPAEVYRGIDNVEKATVKQLLSHTAGIDSWEDDPAWLIDGRGKNVRPAHIWGKTEVLGYLQRPKITAPDPGTWYYSNTNYTILGLMIEAVTKSTAEGELRRRILDPLGMSHTFLEGFEDAKTKLPRRYHVANEVFREQAGVCPSFVEIRHDLIDATGSNLSVSWLAGGMVSSTSDLLKFAFALRDGKLLTSMSSALMHQWIPAMKNHEMGLGLIKWMVPDRGSWLGHSGGVLGFSSGLWWREDGDCVVCVLENVGTVHTGNAASGIRGVLVDSDFFILASQLVATTQ